MSDGAADRTRSNSPPAKAHALDLLLRLLVKPGDMVFAVPFGYYNLFVLLHMHGVRLIGVPRLPTGRISSSCKRCSCGSNAIWAPHWSRSIITAGKPSPRRQAGGSDGQSRPLKKAMRLNVAYMQDESVLNFIRSFQ
ncbi:hypothetical protein [Vreelandella sp. EE7]